MKLKIFVSSVQQEFANTRQLVHKHLLTDPLLQLFFEPILFEKFPADSQSPEHNFLTKLSKSNLYLLLLGNDYGNQNQNGISATEIEYDWAQKNNIQSLAFVKDDIRTNRNPKTEKLFQKIQTRLSYKKFKDTNELLIEINKALITILQQKGIIQSTEFDDITNETATLEEIDNEKVNHFINLAQHKRGFPLREGTALSKILSHLNFFSNTKITNSGILAFGKNPQHFFPTAVIKCAHFHGFHIAKPIPDHRVIKGDVFKQVDETVDFILSKIAVGVGIRDQSNQAPLAYEIPRPVIAEAVVNAIAHRNYQSNGSVQVMLFVDRLEISNPGALPPELTLDKLKTDHASYPKNPHLAEALYQAGFIERFGTGTGEIIRLCKQAGLKGPDFNFEEQFKVTIWRSTSRSTGQATDQATDQVKEAIKRVAIVMNKELKANEIMVFLELKHRDHFREIYLNPSIEDGYVEMAVTKTPNSPNQKYRLTEKGLDLKSTILASLNKNIDILSDQDSDQDNDQDNDQDSDQDNDQEALIIKLVLNITANNSRQDLMALLDLKHSQNFRKNYLKPAIEGGYIEMTIPKMPNSKNQKYRLTKKGVALKNSFSSK